MVTSPDFQSSSPHPPERRVGWGGVEMDFTWETPAVRPRRARPRGDTSRKSGEKKGGAASVPPPGSAGSRAQIRSPRFPTGGMVLASPELGIVGCFLTHSSGHLDRNNAKGMAQSSPGDAV